MPVIGRDKNFRPTAFMDRLKELMLFHRQPPAEVKKASHGRRVFIIMMKLLSILIAAALIAAANAKECSRVVDELKVCEALRGPKRQMLEAASPMKGGKRFLDGLTL
jgi:hypothetical protein